MTERKPRRRTASLHHERHYFRAGYRYIVGIDEAGRGPLAGPVVAAAIALPLERADLAKSLRGARDSKDMSPPEREALSRVIKEIATAWGIGHSCAREIDDLGIVGATKAAMARALDQALAGSARQPDCIFLDYLPWPERCDIPQLSIVKGDRHSLTIACASVLAKVWRDQFMRQLNERYGEYGFARHKGYGTTAHIEALRLHGPCAAHRLSFKPVRDLAGAETRSAGIAE